MKKLSKIFMTIGGVFHIVNGVSLLIAAITLLTACVIFVVTGNLYGADLIVDSSGDEAIETLRLTFNLVAILYLWIGLAFIALAVVSFVASKLTFRASEAKDQKGFIVPLVFAIILDVKIAIVGAVFGLISLNKEENKKPDDDPVADEVIR